jgi:hypothetical protein
MCVSFAEFQSSPWCGVARGDSGRMEKVTVWGAARLVARRRVLPALLLRAPAE